MSEATFTFRVDETLKTAFAHAAKQQDRTGAQLLRDFMRNYVSQNQHDGEYEAWFRRKVEAGIQAVREGQVLSDEEVAAKRQQRRVAIGEGRTRQ